MSETFLRQAEAKTSTEGKLSETTLERKTNSNGDNIIVGNITIKTGDIESTTYNVNVKEFTNKGTDNPAYQNISTILDTCHSIAEVGLEEASCIAIHRGQLNPYTYFNEAGKKFNRMSYKASFINRIVEKDMSPHSTFQVETYIASMEYEKDNEERETGRLILHCLLPIYNNGIEPFDVIVPEKYAAPMERMFSDPESASALIKGNIINKQEEITKTIEMEIGEDIIETETYRVSELMLTGATPLQEQYSSEIIERAVTEYNLVLEEKRQKKINEDKNKSSVTNMGSTNTTGRKFAW